MSMVVPKLSYSQNYVGISGTHLLLTESEYLGMGPRNINENKPANKLKNTPHLVLLVIHI